MIRAFVGPNGSGKTLAMVAQMAIPSWRTGRIVVSNYRLYPERLGYSPSLWQPLATWSMVPRLGRWIDRNGEPRRTTAGDMWSLTANSGCTLLFDEITSVLPSRDSANVPPELQRMLNQFRKPDVWVGWSAPAWARADLMLREVTLDVCEAGVILPRFTAKRVAGSAWPQNRVFRWRIYDAFEYEEAIAGAVGKPLRPLKTVRLWKGADRRHIQSAYDTLEGVELLDHIQCQECGGKFTRKVCKGHAETEAPKLEIAPTQSAWTPEVIVVKNRQVERDSYASGILATVRKAVGA